MRMVISGFLFFLASIAFSASGSAAVFTFDFEEFSKGDQITAMSRGGLSASVSATGGVDAVVAFDTDDFSGGDRDLSAPIVDSGGVAKDFGIIPVIQEDGDFFDPDDEAGGGTFTLVFNTLIRFLGADFIDIEEPGAQIFLDDVLILGPVGVSGDRMFASVGADPANTFGTKLEIVLAGSGSFDNLTVATVPLPAAAWLLIGGLGGLYLTSRRRRAR